MKKLLLLSIVAALTAGVSHAAQQPNVVLFFVDDLGWTDLGFRNDLFETPNIDALAADSSSFEQAYIASPCCSPSRATLATGQHPARLKMVRHVTESEKVVDLIKDDHGFVTHTLWKQDPAQFPSINYLAEEHTTYAEALKALGYYNLFVGKWHLGEEHRFDPVNQGFDRQIGTTFQGSPSNYYPDYFKTSDVLQEETERYLTDKLTDETVEFIESYDKEQPFMLSFWYYGVHKPHIGRKDYVKYFEKKGLSAADAKYAAMIKSVDDSVGRVRAALKAKGIEDDTIVLFTSDQGSWFENPPYRGSKTVDTLCEGGSRVPFFVNWPGVTKPGTVNDSVIQTTDLFPTLVEIAGGNPDVHKHLDGVSLVSTIQQDSTLQRGKPTYAYRAYQDLYVSVREGDWKLLGYRSGRLDLFNVVEDRFEQKNLAEQHPEKVQELVKKLKVWEREMGVEQYSGVQ